MNTRTDPSITRADRAKPLFLRAPMPRRVNAPLGQILLDMGELSPGDMIKAAAIRNREEARIETNGRIQKVQNPLLHRGHVQFPH
ncbi:MAG: hypothetical protein IID42_01320 [Planctomycetes bacterium]|nr:hypothetical protein [Planctomycetota bacterium]